MAQTALNIAPASDLSASTEEVVAFSASDYFLGIAQQAIAKRQNVRISLPGQGDINLLAERGEYHANVPDMEEFCRADASQFEVSALNHAAIAALSDTTALKSLDGLLWEAAFHASQGRLIDTRICGEEVHLYDVIQFRHWPNLTRLPYTANTMRICALLTRQPSSIMLIHRKLEIGPTEVYQVYSAACASGLVKVLSSKLADENEEYNIRPAPANNQGLLRLLFSKLAGL